MKANHALNYNQVLLNQYRQISDEISSGASVGTASEEFNDKLDECMKLQTPMRERVFAAILCQRAQESQSRHVQHLSANL